MAKQTKTVEKKAKKPAQTPEPPVTEAEVVTVTPADVTAQNLLKPTTGALDANHRVDLLHLADDIFRKDPNAENRFTVELRESVNAIVAAGVVSAMVDEAQNGNSNFTAILRGSAYPQLVLAAHDMGIKLPDIKALPHNDDGTVNLPSEEIKVSKEAKQKLKEEHNLEVKGNAGKIELDPEKVASMGDDAIKDALSYILVTGPKQSETIKSTLTKCVDFMYALRMKQADSAEKPADEKDKLADRSTREWLNDAFSYVKPTHLLSGIGTGMKHLINIEKSPISAFLILRTALTDKETGEVCWDDASIADAVSAIVTWLCNDLIAKNQEGLNALDKKDKDYKAMSAKYKEEISALETIKDYVINPSFDIVDDFQDLIDQHDSVAEKMAERIRKTYYKESLKPLSDYKNIVENIQQHAGIILNMFRDPGNNNQNFSTTNLTDIIEYTDEEKVEMRKKAAEAKKEESKNDLPVYDVRKHLGGVE